MEKLKWRDYPMVKKIEAVFTCFDRTHERDKQTDRRTDIFRMTANTALIYSIAAIKEDSLYSSVLPSSKKSRN